MLIAFRYQHIEVILAHMFHIEDSGMKAFRARLRHFRNLGVPDLPKVGSGSQIVYTDDHLHQLFLALEFAAFGIPPKQISEALKSHWPRLREICMKVLERSNEQMYLAFTPHFIGESFGRPEDFAMWNLRLYTRNELLTKHFGKSEMEFGHLAIVDMTQRLLKLHDSFNMIMPLVIESKDIRA